MNTLVYSKCISIEEVNHNFNCWNNDCLSTHANNECYTINKISGIVDSKKQRHKIESKKHIHTQIRGGGEGSFLRQEDLK